MSVLPAGIRSRYNASSFESQTVWKDKYGTKNAQNVEVGTSELVQNDLFAYVKGSPNSRWNLFEKFKYNEWTVVYVARYDPDDGAQFRILDIRGANALFGHHHRKAGVSYHNGWVGNTLSIGDTGMGDNTQWIFAIEQPKRHLVRGSINTRWVDKKGGHNLTTNEENEAFLTILNGDSSYHERSSWNIADIIYWPRILNPNEVEKVKTYLNDYADGNIDVFSEIWVSSETPAGNIRDSRETTGVNSSETIGGYETTMGNSNETDETTTRNSSETTGGSSSETVGRDSIETNGGNSENNGGNSGENNGGNSSETTGGSSSETTGEGSGESGGSSENGSSSESRNSSESEDEPIYFYLFIIFGLLTLLYLSFQM